MNETNIENSIKININKEKVSGKEKFRRFMFVFSVILLIGSLSVIGWYFVKQHLNEENVEELKTLISEEKPKTDDKGDPYLDYYLIDDVVVQRKFKDIYLKNKDFIGWLSIDDTKVDYPVVFTPEDEQFYLRKDFDKNYSIAGTLFVGAGGDTYTPTERNIIYGHHMNDGTMFGGLVQYENEEYYKQHKYIEFDSLNRQGKYEVIAAFRTQVHTVEVGSTYEGFDVYYNNCYNEDDFKEYVKNCKELTPYETSDVSYDEKLIVLSTCAYHTHNGRFVVIAKLVDDLTVDTNRKPLDVIHTNTITLED